MSGGHFDYKDQAAKSEIFGYVDEPSNVFEDKEISELIWDVFDLIHDFDWYRSGDTSQEKYLKAKQDFKNKWFTDNRENRVKRIIDETVEKAKQDLYKTFLGAAELKEWQHYEQQSVQILCDQQE